MQSQRCDLCRIVWFLLIISDFCHQTVCLRGQWSNYRVFTQTGHWSWWGGQTSEYPSIQQYTHIMNNGIHTVYTQYKYSIHTGIHPVYTQYTQVYTGIFRNIQVYMIYTDWNFDIFCNQTPDSCQALLKSVTFTDCLVIYWFS